MGLSRRVFYFSMSLFFCALSLLGVKTSVGYLLSVHSLYALNPYPYLFAIFVSFSDVPPLSKTCLITTSGCAWSFHSLQASLIASPIASPISPGEVLLPLYLRHGPSFVRHLDGEFALAVSLARYFAQLHGQIRLTALPCFQHYFQPFSPIILTESLESPESLEHDDSFHLSCSRLAQVYMPVNWRLLCRAMSSLVGAWGAA